MISSSAGGSASAGCSASWPSVCGIPGGASGCAGWMRGSWTSVDSAQGLPFLRRRFGGRGPGRGRSSSPGGADGAPPPPPPPLPGSRLRGSPRGTGRSSSSGMAQGPLALPSKVRALTDSPSSAARSSPVGGDSLERLITSFVSSCFWTSPKVHVPGCSRRERSESIASSEGVAGRSCSGATR